MGKTDTGFLNKDLWPFELDYKLRRLFLQSKNLFVLGALGSETGLLGKETPCRASVNKRRKNSMIAREEIAVINQG